MVSEYLIESTGVSGCEQSSEHQSIPWLYFNSGLVAVATSVVHSVRQACG
jgi:hypothetical protein